MIYLSKFKTAVLSIVNNPDYSHPRAMREGERARKVGATNMNEKSSRSHTIFRIKIESTNRIDEEEMSVLEDEEGEGKFILLSSFFTFMISC